MADQNVNDNHQNNAAPVDILPAAAHRGPIVTSGESDEGVLEDDPPLNGGSGDTHEQYHDDDSDDISDRGTVTQSSQQPHEYLYDDQADERDEKYVNQHLRSSGIIQQQQEKNKKAKQQNDEKKQNNDPSKGSTTNDNNNNKKHIKKKKNNNSDAVLSCPCCFGVVCMDCQRHERYENQFRAMFVMNIFVQWDNLLTYNNRTKRLESSSSQPQEQATTRPAATQQQQQQQQQGEVYHAVCCANCQTQVAALDMTDEVYHFYGCIAS